MLRICFGMVEAIILLGGNLGNQEEIQETTLGLISNEVGEIKECSGLFSSEAWGYTSNNLFINQVLIVDTSLLPLILLERLLTIEKRLGRIASQDGQYLDRLIDIDILFYGIEVIKFDNLTIPHPLIQDRKFVLSPLMALRPKMIHPSFGKTVAQLYEACEDKGSVKKYQCQKQTSEA